MYLTYPHSYRNRTGHVAGVVTMDGCIKASHGCKAVFYKFVNGVKINCLTGLPFDDRLGFWVVSCFILIVVSLLFALKFVFQKTCLVLFSIKNEIFETLILHVSEELAKYQNYIVNKIPKKFIQSNVFSQLLVICLFKYFN